MSRIKGLVEGKNDIKFITEKIYLIKIFIRFLNWYVFGYRFPKKKEELLITLQVL